MPQRDLEIESYTVSVYNYRRQISVGNVSQTRNRRITLASRVLAHGIQSTVNLNFVPNANTGNIGFVTTPNYFQHTIYAWLPIGEFDEIYDIVRNEQPITASYWAETNDPWDITTPSRSSQIRWVRVGTETEPVGEGSDDDSGDINAILQALAPELVDLAKS
ncbi:MAG: hypothetical protein ACFB6S_04530 [Geminicoccaceae bacterium]